MNKIGYVTMYINELGYTYHKNVFTTKKEAMKKDGASKIEVIKALYDDIYYADNYKGWTVDSENIIEILKK